MKVRDQSIGGNGSKIWAAALAAFLCLACMTICARIGGFGPPDLPSPVKEDGREEALMTVKTFARVFEKINIENFDEVKKEVGRPGEYKGLWFVFFAGSHDRFILSYNDEINPFSKTKIPTFSLSIDKDSCIKWTDIKPLFSFQIIAYPRRVMASFGLSSVSFSNPSGHKQRLDIVSYDNGCIISFTVTG